METRTQMPTQSSPGSSWRFSLQDPKSEAVYNFQDFEVLVAFLQSVLDESKTIPKTDQGKDKNAA